MCNLYQMTQTVDEMRRLFGPFEGDRVNLQRRSTTSIRVTARQSFGGTAAAA
jgi:hypothetical protein